MRTPCMITLYVRFLIHTSLIRCIHTYMRVQRIPRPENFYLGTAEFHFWFHSITNLYYVFTNSPNRGFGSTQILRASNPEKITTLISSY